MSSFENPQDITTLVDTREPSPQLIEYATKVEAFFDSDDFLNKIKNAVGPLMINNVGGRNYKKSNRQGFHRRSTTKRRRQKGGGNHWVTQLMVGIIVGTALLRIGSVECGQFMEWIRTNPNYFFGMFSLIFSKFAKTPLLTQFSDTATDIYKKAILKKIIDGISANDYIIGLISKIFNIQQYGEKDKEELKKCFTKLVDVVNNGGGATFFQFENETFGKVAINLKCPLLCTTTKTN
jgi:hypothetical protein